MSVMEEGEREKKRGRGAEGRRVEKGGGVREDKRKRGK